MTDAEDFLVGQRWLSDTETELGLGTVLDAAGRRVTLVFPASGETRIYARDDPPLTRVAFAAGDTVRARDGRRVGVERVEQREGLLVYVGRDGDGAETELPEGELDDLLRLDTPRERLFAGLFDGQRWYALRRRTLEARRRHAHSPARGLVGARVDVLPHQVHVAAEGLAREHPRLLLADEVGLGKTVEAGLLVHARLARGRDARVLVAVPETLLHQWLVEMLRKFALVFGIVDAERFAALAPDAPDGNPFLAEQLVLCPLETLVGDAAVGDAAVAAGWDTLVVDEAHRLAWREGNPSPDYALVERLARIVPSVLLLTATPERLGRDGHFARLRLLDPVRFGDLGRFREEQAGYAEVGRVAERLSRDLALDETDIARLETLFGEPFDARERRVLATGTALATSDLGRRLVERLVDRHGTGRFVFRNTRASVGGFPGRTLHRHALESDDVVALAAFLAGLLAAHPGEKVLAILSRRETVQALAEALRRAGVTSAQFHEAMTIVERDRAAAWFADGEDGTRLLLCSEIGSEGRNFQFLHRLVTAELPRSPDLLEQRIGRLDRIGQRHAVEIHVPVAPGSTDAALLAWYDEGLDAFARPCRTGAAIEAALGERLDAVLDARAGGRDEGDARQDALDALIADTRALAARLEDEYEAGRDRLLELNSNRPERVAEELDAIARLDRDPALADYMERVFDRFGVEVTEQSDHWLLHPGDHMPVERFPRLPEDGLRATFDRATALAREELAFLSWDHPMVVAAMELVLSAGFGQADCQVVSIAGLPAGLAIVEARHLVDCTAPAALDVERYLPAELDTRRLGLDGRDWTVALEPIDIESARRRHERGALRRLVAGSRAPIEKLLALATTLAERDLPERVARARAAVDEETDAARERLLALARVNPAFDPAEIDALERRRAALHEALGTARARLLQTRVLISVRA